MFQFFYSFEDISIESVIMYSIPNPNLNPNRLKSVPRLNNHWGFIKYSWKILATLISSTHLQDQFTCKYTDTL